MLALLSNLNLVTRIEVDVALSERDAMLQGFWMKPDGTVTGSGNYGWCVWTEADRTKEKSHEAGTAIGSLGSGHFSPDAEDTGQLTAIYGKFRALTNAFDGVTTVGAELACGGDGKLVNAQGNDIVVAVCTGAPANYTHIGETYSCIEFVTV